MVDLGVTHQVVPDVAATGDDAQDSRLDEAGQGALPELHQVLVDRVGLQDHDAAVDDELMEDVLRGQGRHVARAQDDGDAGVLERVPVRLGLRRAKGRLVDARLHPDLGAVTGVEHAVQQ